MLITLQRNQAICSRTTFWSWQMGILTEKVGLFSESRRYLHQIIKNENTGKEYHRSIISLIEAEHGQDSIDKLREISKRSDRVTHVAAEYWILHINSLSGDFNLKRLDRKSVV